MAEGSIKDYEIIERLGEGAQGTVWKVRRKDKKIIALKILSIHDEESIETAKNELDKLQALATPECHPNIVCYYGYVLDTDNSNLLVEMEYIEGEDLDDYAKRLRDNKEYDKLYKHLLLIAKDLIKGLICVHEKDILHNDVKPGNIRIDTSKTPKFVDFGISCYAHDSCKLGSGSSPCCRGFSGTPAFASPEMYSSETRYPQSDIWSLGMSLYESATGELPYNFSGLEPNLRDIFQNIVDEEPKKLHTSNPLLNKIVNKSLVKDPAKRITASGINKLLKNYK